MVVSHSSQHRPSIGGALRGAMQTSYTGHTPEEGLAIERYLHRRYLPGIPDLSQHSEDVQSETFVDRIQAEGARSGEGSIHTYPPSPNPLEKIPAKDRHNWRPNPNAEGGVEYDPGSESSADGGSEGPNELEDRDEVNCGEAERKIEDNAEQNHSDIAYTTQRKATDAEAFAGMVRELGNINPNSEDDEELDYGTDD